MQAADQAIARLEQGQIFAAILEEDVFAQDTARYHVLLGLADGHTRMICLENPAGAELTMAALPAMPDTDPRPILLLILHAETLNFPLLAALQTQILQAAMHGPAWQVVFIGTPAFLAALAAPELAPMRAVLGCDAGLSATADDEADAAAPLATLQPHGPPVLRLRGQSRWRVGLGAGALAAMLWAWPARLDHALPLLALPAATAAAAAPATAAADPVAEAERLRQDFDAFLARSGGTVAQLGTLQRQQLFQEFLAWRAQIATRAAMP